MMHAKKKQKETGKPVFIHSSSLDDQPSAFLARRPGMGGNTMSHSTNSLQQLVRS
jgi:hypothetical protein